MSSSLDYQPAHASHTKENVQKYEFDSPNTIAKQHQFHPAGGPQMSGLPQAPPLPQSRTHPLNLRKQINLRTRDWNSKPWSSGSRDGWQGDSYAPPASLLNSGWSSLHPGGTSSLSPRTRDSGLPSSNYTPMSTIPLHHDYHLPNSGLSQSSGPFDAPLTKNYDQQGFDAPLAKNYVQNSGFSDSGLHNTGFQSSGLNSGLTSASGLAGNIPTPPALPNWGNNRSWRSQRTRPVRPLRTRDWGMRNEDGWSNLNRQHVAQESFRSNHTAVSAPPAPALPSFLRQRTWSRGPYRQRPLRTRNWGMRNEEGWSNFNRGIYMHESALPFNARRSNWSESSSHVQQPGQRGISTAPLSSAPISTAPLSAAPISAAPISSVPISSVPISSVPVSSVPISAAPISTIPITAAPMVAPVAAPKGRRAARRAAKQRAIAQKLTVQNTPPVGDPAINHYRRGAKATVPLAGPAIAGLAPPTGSIASRRRGKRNTLGRRGNRLGAPALPVPATQPPFVAPLSGVPLSAAPLGRPAFPTATYRTLHSNMGAPSSYVVQPQSAFVPASSTMSYPSTSTVPISSGIPLSTRVSQPIYTTTAQKVQPLTNAQGMPISQGPVAAQMMHKPTQAPIMSTRPTGSATF